MNFFRTTPRRGPLVVGLAAAVAIGGGAATAVAVIPDSSRDNSASLVGEINPAKPKNVILLIGDGTDEAIITAARNYEKGADGEFAGIDNFPFVGDMTTHGLKVGPGPDYPKAYVSDSAPTASAWSTGKKTVDSRISQGPSTATTVPGEDYPTVLEQFRAQGKRTGNVTTSELTDATPAAAASHINARNCKGPANMADCAPARKVNGGKGSIAEQLVDNKVDVLLGGARGSYTQNIDAEPKTVLQYAKDKHGYRELATKADLAGVTSLAGGPVLGLFANTNLTPMFAEKKAVAGGAGGAETRCDAAVRGDQPTLSEMTTKALELLSKDNDKGFFLQSESAMVDKQEHAIDGCGAIGDLIELDKAVQVALEFQKKNPDTLVIVTGDHSHSTQIVDGPAVGQQTLTLKTADGDPMNLGYSTGIGGSGHTGSQIRVAAKGPQASNVSGFIDQTDLYSLMLGRTPSTLPSGPTTTVPGPTTTVPGPTTTVTGPTTTAPAGKLSAGVAVPRRMTNASARAGIPASLLSSKAATAVVTLKNGSKTLSSTKVKLTAGTARSLTLKASKLSRNRAASVRLTAVVTSGNEKITRRATISVSKR